VPLGIHSFPIHQKIDDNGDNVIEEEDKTRFLCAWAGDHLMTPFQCETCHVQNMMGWNSCQDKPSNTKLKDMICRANLDSFWSRESLMVSSNLREAQRMEKTMSKYGLPPATPPMGP
jgi:hypothetical protein